MLKNFKIGVKLAGGFMILLVIFAAAGWFAWRNMNEVIVETGTLEERYLPGIHLSNEVENLGQTVMLNVRTYVLGESFADLDAAKKNFEQLLEVLTRGKEHASKHPGLEQLAAGMNTAEEQVKLYRKLLEESQWLMANIATQRRRAAEAAASMGAIAYDLLFDEKDELEKEIKEGASAGTLQYRQENILVLDDLVEAVHKAESYTLRSVAERRIEMLTRVEDELKRAESFLKKIQMTAFQQRQIDQLKKALEDVEAYKGAVGSFREAWKALDEMGKIRTAAGEGVLAAAAGVMNFSVERTLRVAGIVTDQARGVSRMLLFSVLFALAAGVVVALFITRMITRPINRAVALAERAGSGDLTIERKEFGHDGKDEIGILADALAQMVKNQADSVREVVAAAHEITRGAETLAALSEETNASVEEVRSSLEQVASISESNSAALEESNAGVEEVAAGAQAAAKASAEGVAAAEHTAAVAKETVDRVADVIEDVHTVGGKSKESMEKIRALAASVENISRFVSVIGSIADQTNLLALNAAIEAARAGEAGRGFAVVADEVRKLAEESNRAAREVAAIITGLDESARESIVATEEAGTIMTQTASKADEVRNRLAGVLTEIGKISGVIANVASVAENQAASSQEMASAIDQVSHSTIDVVQRVEAIRNASGEMAGASEGVAREASDMAERAERMQKLLARFRLSNEERGLAPLE